MRALILAAALAVLPVASMAQTPCLPHQSMAELLGERFGEHRIAMAMQSGGAVVEVYVNPSTGSWTITLTQPGGPSCAVAAGEAWENFEPAVKGTAL